MAAGQEVAVFYVTIDADTKAVKKALGETKEGMSSLEKASSGIGKVAAGAFAIGATAVVGFGVAVGKSVSAAADMEQGIADIGAMMSLTGEETAQLGDHIMSLGLDPHLKVSATEASAAVMALGTAGASVDDIMGGLSKSTVLLANATGLSGESGLASAASIASDVLAQFNINAADMGAAVNQIAGTTVASKFSIDDYRLAIAQAGGVASAVGVNFDDFNATIAATSPSFASGSDAGTSFKTFLQRLVPTTEDAKEALYNLGLSTGDDFVTAFFTAEGAMRPMEEIAGNLHTAFAGLSDAQKTEAASTIFGTDAMRTALALAEGGTPIIQKMKAEIGKVDAEEMAAKRMDTFGGALEIAKGVIETLSISVGQQFLPVLRPLVERFSELAQVYGPAVVAFFGRLSEGIAAAIRPVLDLTSEAGGLVEQLIDVGKIIGNVAISFFRSLKPITDAIGKWVSWQDVLAAVGVIMMGPVIGAIGAVVAALWPVIAVVGTVTAAIVLLKKAWETNFLGIQDITQDALMFVTNWLREKTGLWKGDWGKTLNFMLTHSDQVWADISGNVVTAFNDWTRETKHIVMTWTTWVIKEIVDWAARTKSHFELWAGWIVGDFGVLTKLKEKAVKIFQAILGWWDDKIQPWIDAGRDVVQGLWDGIRQKWNEFNTWWQGIWSGSVKWVKDLLGIKSPSTVFYDIGANMMEGLADGIGTNAGAVQDALENAIPTSFDAGTSLANAMGEQQAAAFIDNLKQMGTHAAEALQAGGVAKGNAAFAFADALTKESAGSSISSLFEDITGLVSQLNAKGVAGPKANLLSMADFLDRLTSGELSTYVPPSSDPMTGGSELTAMVVDVLKAILAELRNSSQIDKQGFERLSSLLGRTSGSTGGLADFTAGGRR